MTASPFSFPSLRPLTRLHVHDNLRVNAERWSLAHDYHRQRQNIHYQSLWQPGIVYGLGVKQIPAPTTTAPQFRDNRWLEIQPGLAIDGEGNPIVVSPEDDRTYHLALPNLSRPEQTLYLVLQYVDPDELNLPQSTDRLIERFRFDQYIDQIKSDDIELCRITLSKQDKNITTPVTPLKPCSNELDLRHRPQAQLRSQKWVRLGYAGQLSNQKRGSLTTLLEALPALYPQLQGELETTPFLALTPELRQGLDIIFVEVKALLRSQAQTDEDLLQQLKQYLRAGGSLVIEASHVNAEIQQTLQRLKPDLHLRKVPMDHAVRHQPFWFRDWPEQADSIDLYHDEGIWLFVGSITDAWLGKGLARHEIRSYHEWGINLLHHLWMKRYFKALLG